jgi:hypothetical protein
MKDSAINALICTLTLLAYVCAMILLALYLDHY